MGLSTLSGWMSHAAQATESAALGKDMLWFRLKFGYEQLYTPALVQRFLRNTESTESSGHS